LAVAGWRGSCSTAGTSRSSTRPGSRTQAVEVLANARRSLPGLYDAALPPEGRLRFCASLEQAVAGAQWIQESVPERLELKHRVLTRIQAVMANDAVIGSSTSGFKPSELGAGVPRPGQVLVAHPFNPVYLLPVVEVVPHASAADDLVTGALQTLRSIGMMPLRLRREMDAHVADRFLEAVWREALWLVKDDIATTREIDDVIRFGFGIRWAQMGLFETYRIAGGEAGMRIPGAVRALPEVAMDAPPDVPTSTQRWSKRFPRSPVRDARHSRTGADWDDNLVA
jgi:carnitine 3-dehydrogenase